MSKLGDKDSGGAHFPAEWRNTMARIKAKKAKHVHQWGKIHMHEDRNGHSTGTCPDGTNCKKKH